MLARRYLAVLGTSVLSETVFSTAGDTVTASRSRLLAENVDKLTEYDNGISRAVLFISSAVCVSLFYATFYIDDLIIWIVYFVMLDNTVTLLVW